MTDPTMTKTVALLPCPFCGSSAESHWDGWQFVQCASEDCLIQGPVARTEAEAIAAWNTRTQTDQQLREEVEAFEGAFRISVWNRLRDAGVDQDTAIEEVNRAVAEVRARSSLSSSSLTK